MQPSTATGMLFHFGQQRYVLSVILSFLEEDDGTCMLITNTTWTRMLPLFQIPTHLLPENELSTAENLVRNIGDNVRKLKKTRHIYRPLPIQCPAVLLDRLNTLRLSRRIRLASKISGGNETTGAQLYTYPLNMTTEEIAWTEWTLERSQFVNFQQENITRKALNSSKLELLRYRVPPPPHTTMYNFKLRIPESIHGLKPIPKILSGATVLASYPRSGNTLLRTLLERTTGIVTGSDTRPDRNLSKALSRIHSLVGEGIVSHSKTPVIKTHFPERRGYMMYNATRIILLVRNPYDAIDSYWNMCCTNTHTESVTEEVYDRYREKFTDLALAEMGTWVQFLKYWMLKCRTTFIEDGSDDAQHGVNASKIKLDGPPLLLIRFEDLIQKTEVVMEQVIKFITIDESKGGGNRQEIHPFWKWRIHQALGLNPSALSSGKETNPNTGVDTSNLGSYKPRSHGFNESETASTAKESKCNSESKGTKKSSIGKSLGKNRYTDQELSRMHEIAGEFLVQHPTKGEVNILQMLGYDVLKQNFPQNFEGEENECDWDFIYPEENLENGIASVVTSRLNQGPELRPVDNPFGRAMTRWRRSQTVDDTEPFEIMRK